MNVSGKIPNRLVLASRNPGKLVELRALVEGLGIDVVSVSDFPGVPEVEEDGDTYVHNATKKAREVSRATGLPALADDSGLEVDALGGAPGVYSAHYAGTHGDDAANNALLLERLKGVPLPLLTARYRCVLVLADEAGRLGDATCRAEGTCEGHILDAPRGQNGFAYDPLFFSPELGMTFAEASNDAKNRISHRTRALRALLPALRIYFGKGGARP